MFFEANQTPGHVDIMMCIFDCNCASVSFMANLSACFQAVVGNTSVLSTCQLPLSTSIMLADSFRITAPVVEILICNVCMTRVSVSSTRSCLGTACQPFLQCHRADCPAEWQGRYSSDMSVDRARFLLLTVLRLILLC